MSKLFDPKTQPTDHPSTLRLVEPLANLGYITTPPSLLHLHTPSSSLAFFLHGPLLTPVPPHYPLVESFLASLSQDPGEVNPDTTLHETV